MVHRALVIAHEIDGHGCLFTERLLERGFGVDTHIVCPTDIEADHSVPFPPVDGYDIVIPMGSIRSLTDVDSIGSWVNDELDLLRRCHEAGTPMFGVCFGGQLLATALGGSVEKAPEGEFGWCLIEGDDNPAGPGPWMQWHHDRFMLPPGAQLLASSAKANQMFRLGSTVGTQFHPEVNRTHVAGWLGSATDDYLVECGLDRHELLNDSEANEEAATKACSRLVDWFLDVVAFPEG
ncbi:MAG: type 1 glutamine amidotransferase [Actinomycetia bacterium]|nr:type 1 glutamine amidotransferase [Actinomycetes bacterium]